MVVLLSPIGLTLPKQLRGFILTGTLSERTVSCPCRSAIDDSWCQALSHSPLGRVCMVAGTALISDTEGTGMRCLIERTWQCGRLGSLLM